MGKVFHDLIDTLLSEREHFNRIWFAGDQVTPPPFSYQVNFPRLELVISGEYINELEDPELGITEVTIMAGDAIYIPPNSWNKPNWDTDCSVLSCCLAAANLALASSAKQKIRQIFMISKNTVSRHEQAMPSTIYCRHSMPCPKSRSSSRWTNTCYWL